MNDTPKIGIIVAEYHKKVSSEMVAAARGAAKKNNLQVSLIVRVAGVFDIPLPLKRVLARPDIDAAIVLGAVVQGETSHDEIVAYTAAEKIMALSLLYDKPVGYGISGPRMNLAQAKERAAAFTVRAVRAVRLMLDATPGAVNTKIAP